MIGSGVLLERLENLEDFKNKMLARINPELKNRKLQPLKADITATDFADFVVETLDFDIYSELVKLDLKIEALEKEQQEIQRHFEVVSKYNGDKDIKFNLHHESYKKLEAEEKKEVPSPDTIDKLRKNIEQLKKDFTDTVKALETLKLLTPSTTLSAIALQISSLNTEREIAEQFQQAQTVIQQAAGSCLTLQARQKDSFVGSLRDPSLSSKVRRHSFFSAKKDELPQEARPPAVGRGRSNTF